MPPLTFGQMEKVFLPERKIAMHRNLLLANRTTTQIKSHFAFLNQALTSPFLNPFIALVPNLQMHEILYPNLMNPLVKKSILLVRLFFAMLFASYELAMLQARKALLFKHSIENSERNYQVSLFDKM